MITTALILFAIAALGGLVLAGRNRKGQELPMPLSIVHGLVAAAGLVLLIIAAVMGANGSMVLTSLVLFVVAALGGFYLFSHHLRGKRASMSLVMVHGLVAVVAFVILLMVAVNGG